jgi:hypothetical protein
MELTEEKKVVLRNQLEKILLLEAIEEAFNVLISCDEKWYNSFIGEYTKKSFNTACCAIDFAKDSLVKEGKMTQGEGDYFGEMFIDDIY